MRGEPAAELSHTLSDRDATITPWAEARDVLASADGYWLATVREDGQPHVRPLLAVWVDDALYFSAGHTSRKRRNLDSNPRCAITIRTDTLDLVVEGTASQVTDEETLRRVAHAYATKYDWHVTIREGAFYGDGIGPAPYEVFALRPSVAFGFGTETPFSATRWRFQ